MKPTSPTSTELYSPPGSGSHKACPWLGYLIASSSRKVLQSPMEDVVREGCCEPSDNQAPYGTNAGLFGFVRPLYSWPLFPQAVSYDRRQGNTRTVYMWPLRTVLSPVSLRRCLLINYFFETILLLHQTRTYVDSSTLQNVLQHISI